MRKILVAVGVCAALALGGCASRPDTSRSYYKGVYAPGQVRLMENGAFVARATAWTLDDVEMAGEAALARLEAEAASAGYSHFVLDDARQTSAIGHQYRFTGKLYRTGDIPAGALSITQLRYSLNADPVPAPVPVAVKPAKIRKPVARKAPQPLPVEPPAADEPLVIDAPDFITAVPARRPVG